MLERANALRTGGHSYRRSVTLLGKTTSEDLSPLAIALALRKNSKLGQAERRVEEAERGAK